MHCNLNTVCKISVPESTTAYFVAKMYYIHKNNFLNNLMKNICAELDFFGRVVLYLYHTLLLLSAKVPFQTDIAIKL